MGGSAGANELRWATSAGGTTASASWPYVNRPASVTAVAQMWAYTADATGSQVATYTGDNTKANVLRFNWDNLGTYASAPSFTAYGDNTHTTPVAGQQTTATGAGGPLINGSADTSNTAYLKANAYGYGVDTAGVQQTPAAGAAGTTFGATVGTAGAVSPGTGAWLATWQSLQGGTQFIQDAVIPKALTAGFWYFTLILWAGPNLATGSLLPVISYSYSFA